MSLTSAIAGLATGTMVLLAQPGAIPDPDTWFITQNQHPIYHPEPTPAFNSNCGPAALAMALKAYGLAPAGMGPRALVRHVRKIMTGSDLEGTWTYPHELRRAAEKLGLASSEVHGLDEVREAVTARRHLVVANLNPGGAYDYLLAVPYRGGHFTVVVAERSSGFVLNDPLADRPALSVPVQAFQEALLADLAPGKPAYEGGIELWRPIGAAASVGHRW